jgi:hypothetical protein
MGAGIVRGLQGAKGIDVNEHFVAVAGSHSNAVVLFARHNDGSITFLDQYSVGLRSIPSFHHRFNLQPLTLSGPTHVTSSESKISVSSHSNPETVQTSFALDHGHGHGPVRLQRTSGDAVSASDAAAFSISGRHYLAVANQDGLGGGGVSVFLLHRQHLVYQFCQLHGRCITKTFLCRDVQQDKQGQDKQTRTLTFDWHAQTQEDSQVLEEVQRLAQDVDVTCLSHHMVTPRVADTGNGSSIAMHVLAVATSLDPDKSKAPEIRVHRWIESLEPSQAGFELYDTIASPQGIFASGLAQIMYEGQLWLAVSCFSNSEAYPNAGHAESFVYRYSSFQFSRALNDTIGRRPQAAEQMHTLPSRGATDVAWWETPQQQLLLMISNFLGEEVGSVLGDVSVYAYDRGAQHFELLQSIAAQGAYDVHVFQPRGMSTLLGIANRQV